MGKWLYLADVLQGMSVITLFVGCLCVGYAFVRGFTIAAYPEDIATFGRLEEEKIELEERLELIKKFKMKTKRITIVGSVLICLTVFIPTKKEFIQIKLLNEVNTENYNLLKEELEKGTETIIKTIDRIKGE